MLWAVKGRPLDITTDIQLEEFAYTRESAPKEVSAGFVVCSSDVEDVIRMLSSREAYEAFNYVITQDGVVYYVFFMPSMGGIVFFITVSRDVAKTFEDAVLFVKNKFNEWKKQLQYAV